MKYNRICKDGKLSFNPLQHMFSEVAGVFKGKTVIVRILGEGKNPEIIFDTGVMTIASEGNNLGSDFYTKTHMEVEKALDILKRPKFVLSVQDATPGLEGMKGVELGSMSSQSYSVINDLYGFKGTNYPADGGLGHVTQLINKTGEDFEGDIEDLIVPLTYVLAEGCIHGPYNGFFCTTDFGLWERDKKKMALRSASELPDMPTPDVVRGDSPIYFFTTRGTKTGDLDVDERIRVTERFGCFNVAARTYAAALAMTALHSELITQKAQEDAMKQAFPALMQTTVFYEFFKYLEDTRRKFGPTENYYIELELDPLGLYHNYKLETWFEEARNNRKLSGPLVTLRQVYAKDGRVLVTGKSEQSYSETEQRIFYDEKYSPEDKNGFVSLSYALACCLDNSNIPSMVSQLMALLHVSHNPRLTSQETEKIALLPASGVNKEILDIPDLDNKTSNRYKTASFFTRTGFKIYKDEVFTGHKFRCRASEEFCLPGDTFVYNKGKSYGVINYLKTGEALFLIGNSEYLEGTKIGLKTLFGKGYVLFPVDIEVGYEYTGSLSVGRKYPEVGEVTLQAPDEYKVVPMGV